MQVSTLVCILGECPLWNPSVKNQRFLPAPFSKGAFLRPVSFHCAIPGFIRLSIDSVGRRQSQNQQAKTGAKAETQHPSQSEGSIPDGSTRGILKGGTIRAGASCSPLKPASLLTFLPEQESKAPAGSARSQFRTEIFCESLLPLQCPVSFLRCMVGYRQPPASTTPKENRNCTARRLPQSPAVTAPSRRELWTGAFPHRFVLLGKCLL